ncbi:hypothetical protein F2P56_004698 [Juglans regia]|uniref:Uncharacterized protein n=2 Tax=Juglans regia TaxID=51240 RepID=A0A833Y5W5_JUGRE|nr:uncharacterized protein LOC108987146 [Juglans regia]KAF5478111.1 hypothetical protein F2P56_004698 [Juglans regia]
MAKLAFTFSVTFFLFALCYARIPTGIIENDVAGDEQLETTITSPAADTENTRTTILLPSEKHEPEFATMVSVSEETDSNLPEPESNSIPLTMISIRPIDRHFPRRPFPLMFRHGHRCRHHRHPRHDQQHEGHEFKPWGPRFPDREVPYGNDMIVADEKDSGSNPESRGVVRQIPGRWVKFSHQEPRFHHGDVEAREEDINEKDSGSDPTSRGVVRQIPGRWVKFSHEGPRFHHGHDDVEGREHIMKKKRHHRHGEREEWEHENENENEHEHGHGHGGFMKRVRKFLDLF